jgi:sulfoxide reductase heme-binding subunit YedZ
VHLISNPIDWYAARAAGVTAYVLLSAVVILGTTMASRKQFARWPRFAIEDVHRLGGILLGSFIVLHVVTVELDAYLPFPLASTLVPFVTNYRPFWVACGIVSAELLLAIAITNHYRDRGVRYAVWRKVHYLNLAVWLGATVHGLGTGTDRGSAWLLTVYTLCAASVATAIAWRFLKAPPYAVVAGVGTAVIVVAVALGPLQPTPHPWNATDANFSGALKGVIDARPDDVLWTAVMVSGVGGGDQQVWVRADMLLRLHQGLKTSSFVMEYLPNGRRCRGDVIELLDKIKGANYGFRARCRMTNGSGRVVEVHWKPSSKPELNGAVISSRAAA